MFSLSIFAASVLFVERSATAAYIALTEPPKGSGA
jgi:hypothetical protein